METTAGEETVPRELAVVQALVNTIDLEDNDEQLGSPDALRDFLVGHGLLAGSEPVGDDDLALAIELREALRAMLRVNHG
ncbi:MAG TPA: ABATE domain-containing protein, partial [Actinomycetes bacterium]|nr:ABATE domain-containing protein [Actinomycetes bacterium]